jgi:hypothetical protein
MSFQLFYSHGEKESRFDRPISLRCDSERYYHQDERLYHGAHEFKLKGNPWLGQSSDAVPARTLMVRLSLEKSLRRSDAFLMPSALFWPHCTTRAGLSSPQPTSVKNRRVSRILLRYSS